MTAHPLLLRFPAPPQGVRESIDQLADSDRWTDRERAITDPRTVDRPWDPASLPPRARRRLWPWLDQVAAWVNHEYAWQSARVIPPCWPQHPHLVHELAVLACLRVIAADATSPLPMEEWHRYALPGFCERMADRIGPVACPPARHTDWPAKSRYVEFTSAEAANARNQLFEADAPSEHAEAISPQPPAAEPPPIRPQPGGSSPPLRVVPEPEPTEGDQPMTTQTGWVQLTDGIQFSHAWLAAHTPDLHAAWVRATGPRARRSAVAAILQVAADAESDEDPDKDVGDVDPVLAVWADLAHELDPRLTAGPDWLPLAAALSHAEAAGVDVVARLPVLAGSSRLPARHPARELHFRLLELYPPAAPLVESPVRPGPAPAGHHHPQ